MFPNFSQGGNTKQPKYKNKKCTFMGMKFDSIKERDRYIFLKDAEDRGLIIKLQLHPEYLIEINGQKICKYIGDFSYTILVPEKRPAGIDMRGMGVEIVEDVKGFAITTAFKLKEKMVKAVYGIEIQLIDKATAPVGIQPPKLRKKSKPKTTKRKLEL